MGKFDTHGGYFAPKDYFRVNEGGSHSENPNGGVQIGVDQNGVPNLLEENEPVFKDFVFSDNIRANKSILKEMVLPDKYAGKLYSEIADILIQEAEERPMDPISNNGLNAMLGRLADAQEEQKLRKEERELQQMISQLSPEELAMLSSAVPQPQQAEPELQMMQPQMAAPQQMVPQEQYIPQDMMMAKGGNLYAGGSPRKLFDKVTDRIIGTNSTPEEIEERWYNSLADSDKAYYVEHGFLPPVELEAPAPGMKKVAGAGNVANILGKAAKTLLDPTYGWRNWGTPNSILGKVGATVGKAIQTYYSVPVQGVTRGFNKTVFNTWNDPIEAVIEGSSGKLRTAKNKEEQIPFDGWTKANGGKLGNKFIGGSQMYFSDNGTLLWNPESRVQATTEVQNPYQYIKGRGPLLIEDVPTTRTSATRTGRLPVTSSSFAYYKDGEYDKGYRNWINSDAFLNSDAYSRLADYYKSTKGRDLTPEIARRLTLDGNFGKAHEIAGRGYFDSYRLPSQAAIDNIQARVDGMNTGTRYGTVTSTAPESGLVGERPSTTPVDMSVLNQPEEPSYPTGLRYAGVLGNLFAAVNNIAQKPDSYQYRPVSVNMPTMDMPLQMQQYVPLDMTLPMGAIRTQGNATASSIMNSGAGPSTGALLLANGFNTNNAYGNAYLQGVQANTQMRNAAIAANNAAIAQRAALVQRQNEELAQLRLNADLQNNRNALQIQMLNNQAEQAKASAVGSALENLGAGLAGIGTENFRFNMLKNYPYSIDDRGNIIYNRNACGGHIKKSRK